MAGFVYYQEVEGSGEVLAGPDPGGAADYVELAAIQGLQQLLVGFEASSLLADRVAVGLGLLAEPDRYLFLAGLVGDLIQKVTDDLVAVRGAADFAAGGDEGRDHLGAGVGLA